MEGQSSKDLALFAGICMLAALFGTLFPDVDRSLQISNFIRHRSVITHSILAGWVIYYLAQKGIHPKYLIPVAVGMTVGIAIHLSFDAFPTRWWGYALVYLPLAGTLEWIPFDGDSLPIVFSLFWMGGNIVGALWLIERIVGQNRVQWTTVGIIAVITFIIEVQEEDRFVGPLVVLILCVGAYFYRDALKQRWFTPRS